MGRQIFQSTLIVDTVETIHFDKDHNVITRDVKTGEIKTRNGKPAVWNNGKLHRFLRYFHLIHDTMTATGFSDTVKFLGNLLPPAAFTYVGIGTGITPAAVGDTQLQTPLLIKAAAITQQTVTNTGDTLQAVVTFSSGDGLSGTTVAVTEVVLANGTVNGTAHILFHQVYSPSDIMNWNQGDQLQVTVKVQEKQG